MVKAVVFAVIAPMAISFAQADRAAITGTISDQTHLAMSAAHVQVVYPGTGLRRETQSSSVGRFPYRRTADRRMLPGGQRARLSDGSDQAVRSRGRRDSSTGRCLWNSRRSGRQSRYKRSRTV